MFKDNILTETGFLGLIGLITAFLLKCCQEIQNSRCNRIKFCGIECDRQVLSEEYIERLRKEQGENTEENEEKKDTDNNV